MSRVDQEGEETRLRNPFHNPLVTELIEDPALYRRMFSQRVLVGETLQVFQPANVVLLGPQGSGKSMILNMIRHRVLSEWILGDGTLPRPLRQLRPFFGISVNLARAGFQAFGRRSVSRVLGAKDDSKTLDAACSADYLNHYLLREFLQGVQFLSGPDGERLRNWLGISPSALSNATISEAVASWDSWFGYYSMCSSVEELLAKCLERLNAWKSFLNANTDDIPREVWESKSTLGDPLHSMGNLLQSLTNADNRLPLFVVIDQYEALPELNPVFGSELQRVVNTLIKARDPVVFYKIGARTYDWGTEVRVWGAESQIEVQRDYIVVDLSDVLMRREDVKGWLFPDFALDVAYRRMRVEGQYRVGREEIRKIFGRWSPNVESTRYFRKKTGKYVVLKQIPNSLRATIIKASGEGSSPLELRLASAWVLQKLRRGEAHSEIAIGIKLREWRKAWWWKERVGIALLQAASMANQRKRYYGWKTLIYLSGANISSFLLLCAEVWDAATKMGFHPLRHIPLPPSVQTEGIFIASEKWRLRDRVRTGGPRRYEFFSRLGTVIHGALVYDLAISNPGYSGFSLREADLWDNPEGERVAGFLQKAVSYAILEERPHTSKQREATTRRKWYLHPLLSPVFAIPYIRVKEPYYASVSDLHDWLFRRADIRWGSITTHTVGAQLRLPLKT